MKRTPKNTVPWRGGARCVEQGLELHVLDGAPGRRGVARSMRSNPGLNVSGKPHLAHRQNVRGLGEVGPGDQLLDTLATQVEACPDLGGSHQVMHGGQHSQHATRHLTIGTRLEQDSHVTSSATRAAAPYKKAAIPNSVRRQVAARYGCPPGGQTSVPCHHCSVPGSIYWHTLSDGRPSSWVTFSHELDHLIPESKGGPTEAANIVLACRPCNRKKGART